MFARLIGCIAICTYSAVTAAQPVWEADRPAAATNRAAWMARGTYGVMTHYVLQPKGNTPAEKTADLNRVANQFDLDYFMRQFEATGADWLIFTIGQQSGYLCSPSALLDAKLPGHTPQRDVPLEIANV